MMKSQTNYNLDLFLEVSKDEKGDLLFKAIKDREESRLVELIKHNADITLVQNGTNCLQYAASLGHWDCAISLIKHSIGYVRSIDYLSRIGQAFLMAAKANEQEVLKDFFKLLALNPSSLVEQILFSKIDILGKPANPWRDEGTGYTALHWAVKHGNPEVCSLFSLFANRYGLSKLFRIKDNVGNTPFGLAIALNHFNCARKIAKGMTFSYVEDHEDNEVLFKALLNDIKFNHNSYNYYRPNQRTQPNLLDNLFSPAKHKKMEEFYYYFLMLSDEEKRKTGELLFKNGTTLNLYFRNKFGYKYQQLIIEELSRIQEENQVLEANIKRF